MKKDRESVKEELRAEYKRSDFPGGLVRGKYAKRTREASNIVVLRPEIARVFSNEEAVNDTLPVVNRTRKENHTPDKAPNPNT